MRAWIRRLRRTPTDLLSVVWSNIYPKLERLFQKEKEKRIKAALNERRSLREEEVLDIYEKLFSDGILGVNGVGALGTPSFSKALDLDGDYNTPVTKKCVLAAHGTGKMETSGSLLVPRNSF